MTKVHEFTLGFNTLNLDYLTSETPGTLTLEDTNFYQKNKNKGNQVPTRLKIKVLLLPYKDHL